jgi:hypothetical protein
MHHYHYSVSDPANSRFYATAVIEDEELLIDIRTELESGHRSLGLNKYDQLRKILAHCYPRYKSIRMSWWFGDDLATFNRATAAGATLEEAAIATPLGHQVALSGFSRVLIRSLEGFPTRFTKIVVSFEKPLETRGQEFPTGERA